MEKYVDEIVFSVLSGITDSFPVLSIDPARLFHVPRRFSCVSI